MPDEKEIIHEICYFRENQKALEEALLKKVRQMLYLEYDSLASQFEDYKAEQMKAIEEFKRTQDQTLAKFKDELIEYFKNKFEPNFTQSIFEMNKTLLENAYNLKTKQLDTEQKEKQGKVELWKIIAAGLFGAFGIALVQLIIEILH